MGKAQKRTLEEIKKLSKYSTNITARDLVKEFHRQSGKGALVYNAVFSRYSYAIITNKNLEKADVEAINQCDFVNNFYYIEIYNIEELSYGAILPITHKIFDRKIGITHKSKDWKSDIKEFLLK